MKVRVLINLFDIHNEASILAIEKINPSKVIYIVDEKLEQRYLEIEKYQSKIFRNIEFDSYIIKNGDIKKINNILENQNVEESIVNLTGGERINSLILLNLALKMKFRIIYIDALYKKWYEFGSNISVNNDEFKDINLEDIINTAGTNIVRDSSELSEKDEIIDITENIYRNLDAWYKYKSKLYDGDIFIHDESDNRKIIVNLNNVNKEEQRLLDISLNYLKKLKCIDLIRLKDRIEVNFLKDYVKSFIFKSGTWLEVLTEIVIRDIVEIDEVKSGVVFIWNEGKKKVRNELDVLAVKDSILICISCKDSEKYDEDALNELDVYSKRLGGNLAKKILVATKKPCKECVSERAKAMGISLVVLDKGINNFKADLNKIINNEK